MEELSSWISLSHTSRAHTTADCPTVDTGSLDSVKKNVFPLLLNNKPVKFSKVDEFKLNFNSFSSTRGDFAAVYTITPAIT